MAEKKTTPEQSSVPHPSKEPPRDGILSQEELDKVAGGLNPQPLPPRNPHNHQ